MEIRKGISASITKSERELVIILSQGQKRDEREEN